MLAKLIGFWVSLLILAGSAEEPMFNVHVLTDAIFEDVTKASRGVTAGEWIISFKAPVIKHAHKLCCSFF